MAHDEGASCLCVADHHPEPLELHRHHIWPTGLGGPDEPENIVWLCPTTHTNVHELLRLIILNNGKFSFRDAYEKYPQAVSRYAWIVAVEGWRRYLNGTKIYSHPPVVPNTQA